MPSNPNLQVCSVEGCERSDIKAKGLCGLHYDRQRDAKLRADLPPKAPKVLLKDQVCAYEGCERLVGAGGARGYCSTHARAFYYGRLGRERKAPATFVGECPLCHQIRSLDRNHGMLRIRVCQSCYRGRKAPEERLKPGRKPKVYADRPQCPSGHTYVEGSFAVDEKGRRQCLVCLAARRKTHCPRGHEYTEENTYIVNGSPQCKKCRNERARIARPASGIGAGGHNKAKTHCPAGHEYTEENTSLSKDGRRACRICARANGIIQNLKRFSITPERFEAMLEQQDNACLICGRPFSEVTAHIDHDHACCNGPFSCGKCVRAVLCFECNHMLGNAHDEPERLRAAIRYLESYL